jgi:hypothetical protein
MSNKRVTELSFIETLSNDDVLYIVDVSDTTQHPDGSSKKIKVSDLLSAVVPEWGNISGDISDQTDLIEALDLKYDASDFNTDFDTRFGTKTTANLTENTNLYFTNSRAITALTGQDISIFNNNAGFITGIDWDEIGGAQSDINISGFTNDSLFISDLTGFDTDDLDEGSTNQYFTENRVRATALTGLSVSGGSIVNTDSIITAFGKVQNQINSLLGGVSYQGVWNATTNSPAIASGVGTKGHYYVTTVAGSTNIDGITDWKVGDWIIFNGTTWDKVDNTDAVSSVNGYVGAVSLTTNDISENTNLYFTNARARSAISETITGIDYDSGTGVFSITSGYGIPTTTKQGQWDTAYGWGNHASAGYATTSYVSGYAQPLNATLTSLSSLGVTAGSVLFGGSSNTIVQDNTNIFWDNTNKRLGIQTNSPNAPLVVNHGGTALSFGRLSDATSYYAIGMGNISPSSGNYILAGTSTNTLLNVGAGGSLQMRINNVGYFGVSGSSITVNPAMTDTDFIVSSDTIADAFRVDGATGNVGINVGATPRGQLSLPNTNIYTLTRTVSLTLNDYVEIGSFSLSSGTGNFELWVSIASGGYSQSKRYFLPASYNGTNNVWQKVPANSTTGAYTGNQDMDLEVRTNNTITEFRLRRTATTGSFVGSARITIIHQGVESNAFTPSTATGSASAPTATYVGSRSDFTFTGGLFIASSISSWTTSTDALLRVGSTGFLQVNNAGEIGVNTTTPVAQFQVLSNPGILGSYSYSNWNGTGSKVSALIRTPNHNGGSSLSAGEPALILAREGVTAQAYANNVEFKISRYEHISSNSRTQLDIALTHGNGDATGVNVLSLRSNGNAGFGTNAPVARIHALSTSTQQILGYNATNYFETNIDSSANTVFSLTAGSGTPEFTFADPVNVPDEAYGAGWNGSTEVPTKNAIYDKIETLSGGGGSPVVTDMLIPYVESAYLGQSNKSISGNTTMNIARYVFTKEITAQKLSFYIGAVSASGTFKIAIYSEDGTSKILEYTTSTISGAGVITDTFSSVNIPAGTYYVAFLPVGSTSVTLRGYSLAGLSTSQYNAPTGEPAVMGTLTVTADTIPSTVDPTAISVATDTGLAFRLDD